MRTYPWWLLLMFPAGLTAGTVKGYVLNPLLQARVENVQVAFFHTADGRLNETMQYYTDEEGRFTFSGPSLVPGAQFVLAAYYRGIRYPTSTLEIGSFNEVIMEIYEPTANSEHIAIVTHTIIFNVRGQQVTVSHLVEVENTGDSTYVGTAHGARRHVTEFLLPANLTNLRDHAGTIISGGKGHFFDNRPLIHGTTRIAFSFDVATASLKDGYRHTTSLPTSALDILVQPTIFPIGTPFKDLGEIDLHEEPFRHLRMTALGAGHDFTIPLPIPRDLRWLSKWLALGGAGLSALLVARLGREHSTSNRSIAENHSTLSTTEPPLAKRREALLNEIARLDDSQLGRAHSSTYLMQRSRLLQQVRLLYQQLGDIESYG